jgi:hypothetical protein
VARLNKLCGSPIVIVTTAKRSARFLPPGNSLPADGNPYTQPRVVVRDWHRTPIIYLRNLPREANEMTLACRLQDSPRCFTLPESPSRKSFSAPLDSSPSPLPAVAALPVRSAPLALGPRPMSHSTASCTVTTLSIHVNIALNNCQIYSLGALSI